MPDAPARLSAALHDRYTIERELGAGGMATVYLAQDLKHDRHVAIKVLRPELAAVLGAERFVQEIKTTAALSHPHILPLFDSGEADGFLYYVMPYIQSETIREKLSRETQLGIDEAVRITTVVADALDYAHRHGVIHRDIKPENILLHNGRPMVMDFGIALAVSAAAGGRMTETGLSLGTPHYMSPEQATADKAITNRSDIYSLASVLYEMLTGNPPHVGSSAQQIIMKIIAEPVALVTTQRKNVPANIAAALAQALEMLPADRFESATAFSDALTNPTFRTAAAPGAAAPTALPPYRLTTILAAALVLTTALAAWGWPRPGRLIEPVRQYEMSLDLIGNANLLGANQRLAISPDGRQLTVIRKVDDSVRVWLQPRGVLDAAPIPGTENTVAVTFSPDGRRIAFLVNGMVEVATLDGAPPTVVTDTGIGSEGVTWGDAGYLYAVPFDSRRLALTGMGVQIATVQPSVRDGAEIAASAGGTLMYLSGGGLLTAGEPVWVDQHGRTAPVNASLPSGVSSVALSLDGKRLAMTTTVGTTHEQHLAYQNLLGGPVTRLPVPGARSSLPRWSPDGRWIYYLSDPRAIGNITELWRVATDAGSAAERVSAFDDFDTIDLGADWLVAVRNARGSNDPSAGGTRIVARHLEGDTAFSNLVTLRAGAGSPQLSPDGRWLAYGSVESGTPGVHIRPFPHADSANWLVSADSRVGLPLWSPDGRTLYYVSAADSVVALSLQLGSSVRVEARSALFDASPFVTGRGAWAIDPGGTRFLMIRTTDAREATHLVVIENAPAYLKRQADRSAGAH